MDYGQLPVVLTLSWSADLLTHILCTLGVAQICFCLFIYYYLWVTDRAKYSEIQNVTHLLYESYFPGPGTKQESPLKRLPVQVLNLNLLVTAYMVTCVTVTQVAMHSWFLVGNTV